jgi:uncharacterized cupin superfamily protein
MFATLETKAPHVVAGATDFEKNGVMGPVRLFTPAQCQLFSSHARQATRSSTGYSKDRAVNDRFLYDLGTRPTLLSLVTSCLGSNVILWGAELIERKPGQSHPWHTDIESSAPDGGFISIWIGLKNTSRDSALQVITRSHLVGKTVQQVRHEKGVPRNMASSDQVLAWAREVEPEAEFVQPQMSDGEALIFDGRVWHGSHNARRSGSRLALLLQYADARIPIRLRDPQHFEWPFRYLELLPPAFLIAGRCDADTNRIVPPPAPSQKKDSILFSQAYELPLPLAEDAEKRWRSYRVFRGTTPILGALGCHVSVLSPGHSPHLPHAHGEEELLIVLDGEADLIISKDAHVEGAQVERVKPGDFVYYPSYQHHTILAPIEKPVTYLMFKWRGESTRARQMLPTTVFHYKLAPDEEKPRWSYHLFRQATKYLGLLTCHVTVLQPGAGYESHVDPYDVAILLLAGTVETIGQTVMAPSVIFYQAGEPHGMRSVGTEPARYLVFEFRAADPSAALWRQLAGFFVVETVIRLALPRHKLAKTARRIVRRALPNKGIGRALGARANRFAAYVWPKNR